MPRTAGRQIVELEEKGMASYHALLGSDLQPTIELYGDFKTRIDPLHGAFGDSYSFPLSAFGAGATVLADPVLEVLDLPEGVADQFDVSFMIFACNAARTQVVEINAFKALPAGTLAGSIAKADISAPIAIAGTDLVWDADAQTLKTTAGGQFSWVYKIFGGWD